MLGVEMNMSVSDTAKRAVRLGATASEERLAPLPVTLLLLATEGLSVRFAPEESSTAPHSVAPQESSVGGAIQSAPLPGL